MKFNAIVGNPPYMLKQAKTSDDPIYHLFMEASFKICGLVTLITPARFLFNAGKTPKDFNMRVLNDEHFKVVWYKPDSTDVFPNVGIQGGVCVTLRDESQNFGKIHFYTNHKELNSILDKVTAHKDFTSIVNIIVLQNRFNLDALYADHPEYRALMGSDGKEKRLTTPIFEQLDAFREVARDGDVRIAGLIKNVRHYRYIQAKYIEKHDNLYKYKVILPASNGSGMNKNTPTTLIGRPLLCEPSTGYTQSFIGIGAFNTRDEAEAALKYVRTKFMRVMLGVLKVTQHNHTDVWKFVPLQDFTSSSDIDWSASVADIDRQLYDKYGLTADERAFIDRMIKPM